MFKQRFIISLFCLTMMACSAQQHQLVPGSQEETAVLQAKKGYTGDILGAEVVNVRNDEALRVQIIQIKVPIDPAKVDRLEVVTPKGKPITEDRAAQILRDYESNSVGITVYLPKKSNWAFKLKLYDDGKPE